MKTVLDALQAMGKATAREVAARMKIEPIEALNMLRELREQGKCEFGKGGWWLAEPVSEDSAAAQPDQTNSDKLEQSAPGGNVIDATTSVQEILEGIPSFTSHEPGGLLSELQRQVTAAKRRHRVEGQRLKEIDSAVRVLNKPCNRGMVEELLQWQSW